MSPVLYDLAAGRGVGERAVKEQGGLIIKWISSLLGHPLSASHASGVLILGTYLMEHLQNEALATYQGSPAHWERRGAGWYYHVSTRQGKAVLTLRRQS